jgi:hypothetical protein
MNTKELKVILETAEQLGYRDIPIVINDSRDGQDSYPLAKASLKKNTSQHDPGAMLVISYDFS